MQVQRLQAVALVAAGALTLGACSPHLIAPPRPTGPTASEMAEFWAEPRDLATRDLFWGPWGRRNAPDPDAAYQFVTRKAHGFSPGYTVRDARGVKWSVKMGDEAQAEVVASRLVSALGFHQPPVYYLPSWTLVGGPTPGIQGPGRFRPDLPELKDVGEWGWHRAPFAGTRPYWGLLVLMLMLNNSDLKASQNTIYQVQEPGGGTHRLYVVRDLGQSLGETGIVKAKRNDVREFEKEEFILGREGDQVRVHYKGWHPELAQNFSVADVRWTCERLARLTPRQWRDAFAAAGYGDELAERFIHRLQEKVAEGLALQP